MKQIKLFAFILACILCFSSISYAGGKKKEGKKVPITGGIGLLVAAGAALGAKRVFQTNKKDNSDLK
ncbi:MAG TPA: hypothetical protein VFW07_25255 [Parafilimonas sp.]|nr:hypothetical protein [Parafilimonas sp.]